MIYARLFLIIRKDAGVSFIGPGEFESQYNHYNSEELIWNCRLQNGIIFVTVSI